MRGRGRCLRGGRCVRLGRELLRITQFLPVVASIPAREGRPRCTVKWEARGARRDLWRRLVVGGGGASTLALLDDGTHLFQGACAVELLTQVGVHLCTGAPRIAG